MTNHKYEPILGLDICMVCKTIESNPLHNEPIAEGKSEQMLEKAIEQNLSVIIIEPTQNAESMGETINRLATINPEIPEENTCECCNNTESQSGPFVRFKTMVMCQECYAKEKNLTAISEATAEDRVNQMHETMDANRILIQAVKADSSIATRTDIFNAETVAINDLAKAIQADDTIINKPYKLAEMLKARFEHFRNVVFQLNEQLVEVGNQQKAIQVYLNNMANTLRAEEREKLKIADINYKPQAIKPIVTGPRVVKTRTSKVLDKKELAKYAKELGISEFTIQGICVAKGITVEAAAKLIKTSIAQANQTES